MVSPLQFAETMARQAHLDTYLEKVIVHIKGKIKGADVEIGCCQDKLSDAGYALRVEKRCGLFVRFLVPRKGMNDCGEGESEVASRRGMSGAGGSGNQAL